MTDPELLSLRHEIAVVDARLAELLAGLDDAPAATHWDRLAAAWDAVKRAATDEQREQALTGFGEIVDGRRADAESWREIISTMDQRRRLVESERKAEIEADTVMSVTAALAVTSRLMACVYERIAEGAELGWTPQQIITAIRGDFSRLCNLPAPEAPAAA